MRVSLRFSFLEVIFCVLFLSFCVTSKSYGFIKGNIKYEILPVGN